MPPRANGSSMRSYLIPGQMPLTLQSFITRAIRSLMHHNCISPTGTASAGYGTPTYKNSQYKLLNAIQGTIEVVPKVFSPDNDGHDDIATIQYAVTEPGYVANITIFDAAGRPVRNLLRNGTVGLKGY